MIYDFTDKVGLTSVINKLKELVAKKSELKQNSYGEYAGGKNLLDLPNPYSITGTYAKSITVKVKKNTNYTLSVGSVTSSVYQGIVVRPIDSDATIISKYTAPYIMPFNSGDNESIRLLFYSGNATSGTSVYSDVQLEEGTEQTTYEPYIKSNYQLWRKTTQIDDANMLGYVLPEEMPIKNYVDSDGVFHQRVDRVDLGSLGWRYESSLARFQADVPNKIIPSSNNEWDRGLYCSIYKSNTSPISGTKVDMTISGYINTSDIFVYNFSYTNATAFKNAMQGVYLYYELATEKTISVDGNEAVTKVNESLDDQGLLNKFDGELVQGYPSNNDITKTYDNANYVCSKNPIDCNGGDYIEVKNQYTIGTVHFYDSEKAYISNMVFPCEAPSNAKYFRFRIGYVENITPQTVGKISVYINNAIDELKNDLGGLSFSVNGTTLTITDGTNTWTLSAN